MWLASSVAVVTAIGVMHASRTLHPPGGATVLIAVIGSEGIQRPGFYYAFVPVGLGALIMLIVALMINNLCSSRKYPGYWV